jgi:hypothetical protein
LWGWLKTGTGDAHLDGLSAEIVQGVALDLLGPAVQTAALLDKREVS